MSQSLFTHDEKVIINRIKNGLFGPEFLSNVIDPYIAAMRVKADRSNEKVHILIEKPEGMTGDQLKYFLDQKFRWGVYMLEISFGLMDYLISSRLATKVDTVSIKNDIVTFGPGVFNHPTEEVEVLNKELAISILKNADVRYSISDEVYRYF